LSTFLVSDSNGGGRGLGFEGVFEKLVNAIFITLKQQKPTEINDFHLNLSNNSSKMATTFRIREFEKYLSIPFTVCITLLAYIPSLSNGVFCWDDKVVALAPLVEKGGERKGIFLSPQ